MAAKPAILCISNDSVLNRTRRMILNKIADVSLAGSLPEAASVLSSRSFDLLLLCSSLSMQDGRAIVSIAHTLVPPPKVLALAQNDQRLLLSAPDLEFSPCDPSDLLRKIASMTGIEIPESPAAHSDPPPRTTPPAFE
jgi:hypothetical protein